MIVLIRDYFDLNGKRVQKDFLFTVIGAVLLQLGLFLRSLVPIASEQAFGEKLLRSVIIAVGTVPVVAIVVFLAHLFLAYSIVGPLARREQLSFTDYVKSDRYRIEARPKLKQDGGRKWW